LTPAVRLRGVTRRFGDVTALRDVSLDVADGEFFSLLGPSGSGKTTCLRLIAGFDRPERVRSSFAASGPKTCPRTTATSTPSSRITRSSPT